MTTEISGETAALLTVPHRLEVVPRNADQPDTNVRPRLNVRRRVIAALTDQAVPSVVVGPNPPGEYAGCRMESNSGHRDIVTRLEKLPSGESTGK